jgi:hypothetical protein
MAKVKTNLGMIDKGLNEHLLRTYNIYLRRVYGTGLHKRYLYRP